jgi:hypothetical protein
MYTITYVSTASPYLSEEETKKLLVSAKNDNISNDISGVLIYSDGNFFQIIEGEEQKIKKLFIKIEQDPRHYNLIKLLDKSIEAFSFASYTSSFTIIYDRSNIKELNKFLNREKQYNPLGFENISYLTQKFIPLF